MDHSPRPGPLTATAAHPRAIVWAHWLTAAVMLFVFALAIGHDWVDDDTLDALLMNVHRLGGLVIGALALLRLLLRSRLKLAETAVAPWQRRVAAALHTLVYLLLLALPLLGWLQTSARGRSVVLPLIGRLPSLLARNIELADTLQQAHAVAAWSLAALLGAHFGAALWHHFVRRDDVLGAMWPPARRRAPI